MKKEIKELTFGDFKMKMRLKFILRARRLYAFSCLSPPGFCEPFDLINLSTKKTIQSAMTIQETTMIMVIHVRGLGPSSRCPGRVP
jgi:hypothetical protein